MVDVKRLQEMYPSPGLAGRARYCVGGALLLHLGREATGERRRGPLRCWPEWMPTPPELADVLRGENPALTDGKAIDYAGAIVRLNDDGEFAASWAKLDEALRAGRDEPAAEAA